MIPAIKYEERKLNPERMRAILEYAGHSILDVGCGNGSYVLELAERFDIKGVDIKESESWSQQPEYFSILKDSKIDFPEGSFDTLLSFETLEHCQNPLDVLKDYHRLCKKNLILTVPNCDITQGMRKSLMTYYHWVDPTHINFFSTEAITELVKKAGFRQVETHFINQADLTPLMNEAFNFDGIIGRVISRLMRFTKKRQYFITCLVIAYK